MPKNWPSYPDTSSGDLPSMGMTRSDPSGMFIGRVSAVDEDLGTVSLTMINYAGGLLENVPLKMPAVGVDWGIACLPLEGDLVEIDWTPDGDPYAMPTIPFRYWDWIGQSGIKKLKKGELFFRGTGGGIGLLSAMGSVLWKDSVGSMMKLDPVQELATLFGKGVAQVSGGSSVVSVGNILRFMPDSETGLSTLQAVGLPKVPGILPANEYRSQVVPSQPIFSGAPLSLVDLRRGDVFDNDGNRVQKSSIINASEQRVDTNLGFQHRKEIYYTDGSYTKEFGTIAPMIFGQEWDGTTSNTWTMSPLGLSKFELLKLIVDVLDPFTLSALQLGMVRRLVDERVNKAIMDHCHEMSGLNVVAAIALASSGGGVPTSKAGVSLLAAPPAASSGVLALQLVPGNDPLGAAALADPTGLVSLTTGIYPDTTVATKAQ